MTTTPITHHITLYCINYITHHTTLVVRTTTSETGQYVCHCSPGSCRGWWWWGRGATPTRGPTLASAVGLEPAPQPPWFTDPLLAGSRGTTGRERRSCSNLPHGTTELSDLHTHSPNLPTELQSSLTSIHTHPTCPRNYRALCH